jgi:hypothetical protein
MSPGLALTSALGLVFGNDTMDRTVEVVGLLTGLIERVTVSGTWYESPDDLAQQIRAALR